MEKGYGKCFICRDTYTLHRVEAAPETIVHICCECMEISRENFIWLCTDCGKSYIKPKDLVISRTKDREMKRIYMLLEDMNIIQGIEGCISCNPELILDYAEMQEASMEC